MLKIENASVVYHKNNYVHKFFICAQYDDQDLKTLLRLGRGVYDHIFNELSYEMDDKRVLLYMR